MAKNIKIGPSVQFLATPVKTDLFSLTSADPKLPAEAGLNSRGRWGPSQRCLDPLPEFYYIKISKRGLRKIFAENRHSNKKVYREPETQQNARPFGSSMAEWQHFGRAAVNKQRLCGSLYALVDPGVLYQYLLVRRQYFGLISLTLGTQFFGGVARGPLTSQNPNFEPC